MRQAWLGALCLMSLMITVAQAQGPYRPRSRSSALNNLTRPTVSPYLNLLRNDDAFIPNYQTLVRPLVEQRNSSLDNRRAIEDLERRPSVAATQGVLRAPSLRTTGHTSYFSNTLQYFGGSAGVRRARR